jgi:hypothetical protein
MWFFGQAGCGECKFDADSGSIVAIAAQEEFRL